MGSKYRFFQNIFKTEVFMTSQQNNDTNTTSEPNWMKEDCVQSIPKEKLHFLQKLVFESSSLSQKELLPFLMALGTEKPRSIDQLFRHGNFFHSHGDPQICNTGGTAENESDRPPDGKENARKEGVNLPPSGHFQEIFRGSKFADNKTFCDPSVL